MLPVICCESGMNCIKKSAILPKALVFLLACSLILNFLFIIQSWQRTVVSSVPDGDSLQLSDGRRVRLLGIDAPERGNCIADDAQKALETAAKGKHIRMKNVVTDDYGRILANVIIEDFPIWLSYMRQRLVERIPLSPDPYLNRMMVTRGLARFESVKNEYYDTLKTAQSAAKEQRLGVWSDLCRKTTNTNPDCEIKGNTRDGNKTYHSPNCANYTQTIIDESYGDRWFCSEEEAEQAGFSKAAGCQR